MPIGINGSGTITGISAGGLPDATITQAELASGVAGNGPAFAAQTGSSTSFSANTWTKVTLQTEFFDTASCFDNSTNYRFTPNVAGYYQFNGYLSFVTSLATMQLAFYKNGSTAGDPLQLSSASGGYINKIIYMNGSTDYLEIYGFTSTTQNCVGAFSGALVRAA